MNDRRHPNRWEYFVLGFAVASLCWTLGVSLQAKNTVVSGCVTEPCE